MAVSPDPRRNRSPWLERRVIAYAHQGGAWEGPSSTLYAIAAPSRPGPPASSSTSMPPPTGTGGLPRPHGRPHHGRHRSDRRADPGEVRALDNAYWWAPGADVTPGSTPDAVPVPGPGPRRPPVRGRPAGGGPRRVPRGGAQPRHQADRPGGRPLRGGAGRPAPAPRSDATTSSWPRSSTPPPTPSRRSPPRSPRRPAPWPRPSSPSVQAGEAPAPIAMWRCRSRSPSAT